MDSSGFNTGSVIAGSTSVPTAKQKSTGCTHGHLVIRFRDSVDALEQVNFDNQTLRLVSFLLCSEQTLQNRVDPNGPVVK